MTARGPQGHRLGTLAAGALLAQRTRWIAVGLWLVAICLLEARPASATPEPDLIGLVISGREVATLLVLNDERRLWLPLGELAAHMSVTVLDGGDAGAPTRIETPLGTVTVPSAHVLVDAGISYVDEAYLSETLNLRVHHDRNAGTLAIDVPWHGRRQSGADHPVPDIELVPQVHPQAYGLASIHGRVSYEPMGSGVSGFDSTLRATGFAYEGVWQVAYDEIYGQRRLRDVFWMRQIDDHQSVQIGHQTLALHPLMKPEELTGAQWAWSSRPVGTEGAHLNSGALLDRWNTARRSFHGRGPVGGFAELWINGLLVSRQDIGIDGTYRFEDVGLPARQADIEIQLFDPHNPYAAARIERQTLELSELLLDQGQTTVVVAAGHTGNAFAHLSQDALDEDDESGLAAVGLVRWGASEDLTLEAGARLSEDGTTLLAGTVARVLPGVLVTAAVALDETGRIGHDVGLTAEGDHWRLLVNSFRGLGRHEEACEGAVAGRACSPGRRIDQATLSYLPDADLEIGLMARRDEDTRYLLPFVYWRPARSVFARLRPDNTGHYRFDATWWMSPTDTAHADVTEDLARATFQHRLPESDVSLTWGGGYNFIEDEVEGLVALAGNDLLGAELDWRIALTARPSGLDLEGALRRELAPGVYGFLEASTSRLAVYGDEAGGMGALRGDAETQVRIGLSFDLGFTDGGQVVAAVGSGVRADAGRLAGVVAPDAASADLSDIPILVDGTIAGRTRSDGSFLIDGVRPGNRIVSFDDERLPLEHVAEKRSIVARVAPGAVTSMTFETTILYGAAGQVTTAAGKAFQDVEVVIAATDGTEAGRARTNQFGYFRVDNLPTGTYEVRVTEREQTLARQSFDVRDDFVFGLEVRVAR
ncbi:MAG: hypothetical protein GC150_17630 [Rhizobiales bacterium]|nr:hypothetical protein [Hyphomicrobiales bacterium]